jgi:hypothetical protein
MHRSYLIRVVYEKKTWKKKGNYHMASIVIVLHTCPFSNHNVNQVDNQIGKAVKLDNTDIWL